LLREPRQRGLLDETLVASDGEFGRTVFGQGKLTPTKTGCSPPTSCVTSWIGVLLPIMRRPVAFAKNHRLRNRMRSTTVSRAFRPQNFHSAIHVRDIKPLYLKEIKRLYLKCGPVASAFHTLNCVDPDDLEG
jgi:hypothetical protein